MNADTVVRAKAIYDFSPDNQDRKSIAIANGRIIKTSTTWEGCDALIGPDTEVISEPNLTVTPGLFDTHNHFFWTSQDIHNVNLESARSISDVQELLRERANTEPEGTWIVSSRRWHESVLREDRLPTAAELDAVSTRHPILVRRGGHVASANSKAFELAGISAATPDPPGGTIERTTEGEPAGPLIEFPAFFPLLELVPTRDRQSKTQDLRKLAQEYNAMGITAVRDPGLDLEAVRTYIETWEKSPLPLRINAMFRLDPSQDTQYKLNQLENINITPGYGDEFFKIDGLKIFSDGGVEGGWLSESYENDEHYHGHGLISEDDLYRVVRQAASQNWKVGTHAVGDLALEMVLNVYQRVIDELNLGKEHGLVVEHAFFADADSRAKAIALNIPITVQHPLLYALGGNMVKYWGAERTAQVMPVQAWLDEGGQLSAGSDCNVAPPEPMLSIWGLITRDTLTVGIQGQESAIDRRTAFRLYTFEGARLVGEHSTRGRLLEGYAADFVCFDTDVLECTESELREAKPVMTWVNGKCVYSEASTPAAVPQR